MHDWLAGYGVFSFPFSRKAEKLYRSLGSYSLLLSWLPIVGDPLCLVGGVLRVRFIRFSLRVFSGKLARYGAVAWLALKGASL